MVHVHIPLRFTDLGAHLKICLARLSAFSVLYILLYNIQILLCAIY